MLKSSRTSHPIILLIDEVLRLSPRLRTIFAGVTSAVGLSAMETTVLSAVIDARTAPTVPQIGRSLGHPRQVIQRAANALIEKGLIDTAPNPHHKRAPLLLPTERGCAVKREADQCAMAQADALLDSLDADKCIRLGRELRELRGEIEAYLRTRKES